MYDEKMFSLNVASTPNTDVANASVITEAVFKNGKEKIKPIEDAFSELANIYQQYKSKLTGKNYSYKEHEKFYKDEAWKKLEKAIIESLGIRSVIFSHMTLKSKIKNKPYLNCFTYTNMYNRFPIDGLITDDGFYDSSHTIVCEIIISQELFDICTPEEITAIFLHELGHNIDPALVDIKYTGTDILIDSMLGKEVPDKKIDKIKSKLGIVADGIFTILYIVFILGMFILPAIINIFKKIFSALESKEKKLQKIEKLLETAKEFNKKNNSEAYADNIARMYGYGAPLISALRKIGLQNDDIILYPYKKSRSKRREKVVLDMYISALKDEHGVDVQRIMSLIKEYEGDLKSDTVPDNVKKWLKEDKEQLEALLDEYINHKDRLRANINKMIKDAMVEIDDK